MPFDDDAEADNPGFSPPPHPDDRLWRHPSEIRAHPIVRIGASGRPTERDDDAATERGVDRDSRSRGRPWGGVVAAAAFGAVVAGGGVMALGVGDRVVERQVTERVALASTVPALDAPRAVADVRERAAPAVVAVESPAAAAGEDGGRDEDGAAGLAAASSTDETAGEPTVTGSGVVVRDDGIVITSLALLPATGAVTLRLADGSEVGAEVVGTDPATGLAVLDLDGDGYTPGVLATAADLSPGDRALALGAPAAGAEAGGTGVVGDTERYLGPGGVALDGIALEGDADELALGGPVLDERGAVVGIVTTVEAGQGWYVVPIEVAHKVTDDLLAGGVVRHGWLGIEGTDAEAGAGVDTRAAATTAPSEGGGTRVASVVPDSPAARGGLRAGDVIVALDGESISRMPDVLVRLRARSPGDRVEVTVSREGDSRVTLVITLGEPPAPR